MRFGAKHPNQRKSRVFLQFRLAHNLSLLGTYETIEDARAAGQILRLENSSGIVRIWDATERRFVEVIK